MAAAPATAMPGGLGTRYRFRCRSSRHTCEAPWESWSLRQTQGGSSELALRASFFQLYHQRAGTLERMLLIGHEDVLIFRRAAR